MNKVVDALREDLKKNIDPKAKESFKRFFKEEVRFYGLAVPAVNKIAARHFEPVKKEGKEKIFLYCEELLRSGMSEDAWIAGSWAYKVAPEYTGEDFEIFERWIDKYIDNWAECDTLCNHAVGTLVEKFPSHVEDLKRWARSENRWMKRASSVTLILPARRGKFLKDVFEIADILLLDKDDLVQKGYGWMLKEASRQHQNEVLDYVLEHKNVMPRTALRYAIEKMPQDLRKKAMEK